MRFDLKTPCKHCPFRRGPDAIRFACEDRAREIEEIAYREGFVCHQTGESIETDDESYIDFKEDGSSQHCAGALIMFSRSGMNSVPLEELEEDEEAYERLMERLDWTADVFYDSEEFFEANRK